MISFPVDIEALIERWSSDGDMSAIYAPNDVWKASNIIKLHLLSFLFACIWHIYVVMAPSKHACEELLQNLTDCWLGDVATPQ